MGKYTSAVKGTQDVLPQESYKWQYIERILLENARNYGFKEIRVPVFEHTELFDRSVGDTTDVVQKEMYTFDDKGGRSITLRPEGTAGTVRSVIEHGLFNEALPLKCSYILSCYRRQDVSANFTSSAPSASVRRVMRPTPRLLPWLLQGSIGSE